MSTKKDYSNYHPRTLSSIGIVSRPHYRFSERRRLKRNVKIVLFVIVISILISLLIFHVASAFQSKPDKQYTQVLASCNDRQIIEKVKSNNSNADKLITIEKCYRDRMAMELWQK